MAIFAADPLVFAVLWDYDHPSHRAATEFFELVRRQEHSAVTLDLAVFQTLQTVVTTLGGVTVAPDILLTLARDILLSFADWEALAQVRLERAGEQQLESAFVAAIAWDIPLICAATIGLALAYEVPLIAVAGDRHDVYAGVAAQVPGLDVRLLQD